MFEKAMAKFSGHATNIGPREVCDIYSANCFEKVSVYMTDQFSKLHKRSQIFIIFKKPEV
jgi:hypothetical protein